MNKKILTLLVLILSISSVLMLSKSITKKSKYKIIRDYFINSNYVLVKIENKDRSKIYHIKTYLRQKAK